MKITRVPINVVAFTENTIVKGVYMLSENSRLTDILNSGDKDFLPLKDATITSSKTNETIGVPFVSLNRKSIEVIYEENTDTAGKE